MLCVSNDVKHDSVLLAHALFHRVKTYHGLSLSNKPRTWKQQGEVLETCVMSVSMAVTPDERRDKRQGHGKFGILDIFTIVHIVYTPFFQVLLFVDVPIPIPKLVSPQPP